jgi:putative SOS response-associated peptidase YedK
MCNYIGIRVSKKQLILLKRIEKQLGILAALKELQSGFEYGNWGIIKANADKTDIDISLAHWEFIPPWIKDTTALKDARKQGIPWLNATAEKLLDGKMFRNAALNRRCLCRLPIFSTLQK